MPATLFSSSKKGGRIGIIVPDGFLVNSNYKAFIDLRQYLINNATLDKVISLPQGAFQPYNGVKTSILIFKNCKIQKTKDYFWYYDVKNDGYTLDKKRIKINGTNDLDIILSENNIENQPQDYLLNLGINKIDLNLVIKNNYVLAGSKYIENKLRQPGLKKLKDLFESKIIFQDKGDIITKQKAIIDGKIPVIAGGVKSPYNHNISNYEGNIITISSSGSAGYVSYHNNPIWASDCIVIKSLDEDILNTKYLYYCLKSQQEFIYSKISGATIKHIYWDDLKKINIPIVSINNQLQKVEELENYEKIIKSSKDIIKNYKDRLTLPKNVEYITKKISDICQVVRGSSPRPKSDKRFYGGNVPRLTVKDINRDGMYVSAKTDFLTEEGAKYSRKIEKGEIVIVVSGNPGVPSILSHDVYIHDGIAGLKNISDIVSTEYVYYYLIDKFNSNLIQGYGSIFKNITTTDIKNWVIKIPDLQIQNEIVKNNLEERNLVFENEKLIKIMTTKLNLKLKELIESN